MNPSASLFILIAAPSAFMSMSTHLPYSRPKGAHSKHNSDKALLDLEELIDIKEGISLFDLIGRCHLI